MSVREARLVLHRVLGGAHTLGNEGGGLTQDTRGRATMRSSRQTQPKPRAPCRWRTQRQRPLVHQAPARGASRLSAGAARVRAQCGRAAP